MRLALRLFSLQAPSGLRRKLEAELAPMQVALGLRALGLRIEESRGELVVGVTAKSANSPRYVKFKRWVEAHFPEEFYSDEGDVDALVREALRGVGPDSDPAPISIGIGESVTGGQVTARLIDPDGAGYVFGGIVAYADHVKVRFGVPRAVLVAYGSVSVEAAVALATVARRECKAEVGLATTGWAGSTGGSPGKPVGTVCLAVVDSRGSETATLWIDGDRATVREVATTAAMHLLWRRLRR